MPCAGSRVLPPLNGGLHCGRVRIRCLCSGWPVLPPLNGGLHCGDLIVTGIKSTNPCSRLSTAGSIAACSGRWPTRPHPRCSRLSTAGSIAAVPCAPEDRRRVEVLPPLNGGLHCGRAAQSFTPASFAACSRLSTAGSIAASGQRPSRARRGGCSRLSTAGSIAARSGRSSPSGRGWCSRLSTAGSIAAATSSSRSCGTARVLPPLNGGLHCGDMRHLPWSRGGQECSRLSTAGSIAAGIGAMLYLHTAAVLPLLNGGLHCGIAFGLPPDSRLMSAPASQRRAPLRLRPVECLLHQPGHVLPPLNGGLHCGESSPALRAAGLAPCSRLSTAGSIAASPPPSPCSTLPHVLPPLNGGLHCGFAEADSLPLNISCAPASQRRAPLRPSGRRHGGSQDGMCSRLSTAGSIAARRPSSAASRTPRVLPPLNGGLHCGQFTGGQDSGVVLRCSRLSTAGSIAACATPERPTAGDSAPASQRRAPLRHAASRGPLGESRRCSRLSTAGSIAATRRRTTCSRSGWCSRLSTAGSIAAGVSSGDTVEFAACSRLSTAGSIAACNWRSSPRTTSSAPASQRRAPLRHPPGKRVADGLVQCSRLSTAGSIAAAIRSPAGSHWSRVLPPLNGGLHCGTKGKSSHRGKSYSAPASQRRAPLRPGQHRTPVGNHLVLPPLNGGLHCGPFTRFMLRLEGKVLPPLNGGLHCGRSEFADVAQYRIGCSRLSTAGSIAAAVPKAPLQALRHRAPASQRRAPLRPVTRSASISASVQVLPPLNGGLHCGEDPSLPHQIVIRLCSRLSTAGSIAAGSSTSLTALASGAPASQRRAPLRPIYEVHAAP